MKTRGVGVLRGGASELGELRGVSRSQERELTPRRAPAAMRADVLRCLRASCELAADWSSRQSLVVTPRAGRGGFCDYLRRPRHSTATTHASGTALGLGTGQLVGMALLSAPAPKKGSTRRPGHRQAGLAQVPAARRRALRSAYDLFRGRVIVPIEDRTRPHGGLRGAHSCRPPRNDGDDAPKYVNSPETPDVPQVQRVALRTFSGAQCHPAQRGDRLLIVEGYFDVHQPPPGGLRRVHRYLWHRAHQANTSRRMRPPHTRAVVALFDSR